MTMCDLYFHQSEEKKPFELPPIGIQETVQNMSYVINESCVFITREFHAFFGA
jgi:hypothetical protein